MDRLSRQLILLHHRTNSFSCHAVIVQARTHSSVWMSLTVSAYRVHEKKIGVLLCSKQMINLTHAPNFTFDINRDIYVMLRVKTGEGGAV